ncbi:MAG: YbbR-like domain-containing protein [Spirochaetota bacterium]
MEGAVIFRVLRYIFIEDYIAKLICLAIGSGLWFYVEFARVAQTTLNIPVEYIKKPANLYLKSGQARFVKIVVRGREEFLKFSTTGIKAEVSLANAKSGEGSYPLIFDSRQLPERVELASRPENLSVSLEKGLSRVVPVRVATTGNPDAQYRVLRATSAPQQIEIDGPEAAVAAIQAIETEPVDIEGARANIQRKANLRIPDQVATDKLKNVVVRVELIQKTYSEEQQFEQIPLKVQNLDAALNAALSDNSVSVLVQGESGAVKKLKSSDFYAWINAEDTRYNARTGNILPYANESGMPVKARILSGNKKVQIVAITPDKVNVRFSVKPEYAKKAD